MLELQLCDYYITCAYAFADASAFDYMKLIDESYMASIEPMVNKMNVTSFIKMSIIL